MALMFMSWSVTNLKRKTQNGHCQNIDHPHGDTNPRLVKKEQYFIKNFTMNVLKLSKIY